MCWYVLFVKVDFCTNLIPKMYSNMTLWHWACSGIWTHTTPKQSLPCLKYTCVSNLETSYEKRRRKVNKHKRPKVNLSDNWKVGPLVDPLWPQLSSSLNFIVSECPYFVINFNIFLSELYEHDEYNSFCSLIQSLVCPEHLNFFCSFWMRILQKLSYI